MRCSFEGFPSAADVSMVVEVWLFESVKGG